MIENDFAGVADRIKALFVDYLVMVLLMFAASQILSGIEPVPDFARPVALIFILLLYDPVFTSAFGGTIGHMIIGIRVKRENDQTRNLLFPIAVIRYLVKQFLGIISLFVIYSNDKRQAIHDYLANSVVIVHNKKPEDINESLETE